MIRTIIQTYLFVVALELGVGRRLLAAPAKDNICSDVVAVLPTRNLPAADKNQPRFEIRQCPGNRTVQILALEARATSPAVFLDTYETWPALLFHAQNVLVIQAGGSGTAVYILSFANGKAQKLLSASTRGVAAVHIDEDWHTVTVDVPPDARLTNPGVAKRFSIKIDLGPFSPPLP